MANKEKYIKVLSQFQFDSEMEHRGINDSNVEELTNEAFISIIGTEECLKYYLEEEDTVHYFKENHPNVLNLEFDDLGEDFDWKGHIFKTITWEQAKELYDFIKANLGKNFTIHCRAGMSRSQAVGCFIYDMFNDVYTEEKADTSTLLRHHLNHEVMRKLKHILYEAER